MVLPGGVHLKSNLSAVRGSVLSQAGYCFSALWGGIYLLHRKEAESLPLSPTNQLASSQPLPSFSPLSLELGPGKTLGSEKIPEEAAMDQSKSCSVRYAASAW